MGSGCSCCRDTPNYQNGTPLVSGGTVTACFTDGRLFKIVSGKKWYFYNDTQDCKMVIRAEFGAGSDVALGPSAKLVQSGANGACTVTVDIYPLDTIELVKVKEANGYKVTPAANYFSASEQAAFRAKARDFSAKEMSVMQGISKSKGCTNEHELLTQARKASKNYVDLYFPPTDTSLYRPGVDKAAEGALKDVSQFCWRRPENYLPASWKGRITLFSGVSPSDIDQGQLGDCYFLCSCAALAEHPSVMKTIFESNNCCCIESSERKRGGWRVTLNIHGWWRTYLIDSYLPSKSLLPSFARNRHSPNELWISFLEKAYAKAYGSYQAIVAGFPWQALEDLTGFPAFSFDDLWEKALKNADDRDKLFTMMQKWNEDDYLLSIATPSPGSASTKAMGLTADSAEKLFDKIGLATGHAYTVLSVKHFPLHKLCMLKIRNPWGNGTEWTGDWGDDSHLWKKYPLIKLACKPEKKEDGIFWMEWQDVIKYYDSGSVCFRKGSWHSRWHDYRVPGCFSNCIPDMALEIVVKKTTCHAFFTLHQKDKRGLADSDSDSKYAALMLSLAKGNVDGSGTMAVIANSSENPKDPQEKYLFQVSRSVGLYYTLEKNTRYLVIPRRMKSQTGNNADTKKFILSMISSDSPGSNFEVNFVRIDKGCQVFENLSPFNPGKLVNVSTVYQSKHGNNVFKTKKGLSFHKGSTEKTSKYEKMM